MRKITVDGTLWYWDVTGDTVFITNKQRGSAPIRVARSTIGVLSPMHCDWCGGACESDSAIKAYSVSPANIRQAILNHATTLQQPARRGKKRAAGTRSISHRLSRTVSLSG